MTEQQSITIHGAESPDTNGTGKNPDQRTVRSLDILDNIATSYVEMDLRGNFTFVNDNVCKDLGYSRDELMGKNFSLFTTADKVNDQVAAFTEIYRTGQPKTLPPSIMIKKDGTLIYIEHSANVLRDGLGNIIGFFGVSRDITERMRVEEALRKSEEKYRNILESMKELYTEQDLKGNLTFVNEAACKHIGYAREQLLGMNYRSFIPPKTTHRLKEVYSEVYETGQPALMVNYELIPKGGPVRSYQADISLLRDPSGRPIGFRNLARDVTDFKRAEEEKAKIEQQFFQAQKMESVGRLAGGIAHDFNNMLTVILGYTELIKLRLKPGDPFFAEISEIEKAAGQSRDITRQLLAFSRKEIILPEPISLNNLIEDVKKTLLRLIGEDIDLKFYPGENLWTINADPSQMQQVLMNFSINARDAMPEGGKLTIETENIHLNDAFCKTHPGFLPGDYVLLGVSDDGVGMDQETMNHLFEPFFTTKEKGKGTGLGLATIYGIIKQNEGFISVYSEPGNGTTFKIYIPRGMEKTIRVGDMEEVRAGHDTGTVLLVEDNVMVRSMTTEMLEVIGYTVIAPSSPIEALSYFDKADFNVDLVMTDVMMPQMNGRELGERIAELRPRIRVLFMSGYTTNVIVHRGVLADGVHFIHKPFSLNDLARKTREALGRK
jgi:two-component system, cell cycle sensor histidine kinase and response regulator CckA